MRQYMDAIAKAEAGPGLELRQVPVPQPKAGEVLIKVHKTAICDLADEFDALVMVDDSHAVGFMGDHG